MRYYSRPLRSVASCTGDLTKLLELNWEETVLNCDPAEFFSPLYGSSDLANFFLLTLPDTDNFALAGAASVFTSTAPSQLAHRALNY